MRNGLNGFFINGYWCEDKELVKDKVRELFKIRFESGDCPQVKLDNVPFNFVFDADNEMLVKPFFEEEIKLAIWSCDSSKSLGPDGFNFGFIKFCWDFLKDDILLAVNGFARFDTWPRGTNTSFVCFVPKSKNPQQLSDFRPISLVGCLYKIITKMLSLRLKKVISKVIDLR